MALYKLWWGKEKGRYKEEKARWALGIHNTYYIVAEECCLPAVGYIGSYKDLLRKDLLRKEVLFKV